MMVSKGKEKEKNEKVRLYQSESVRWCYSNKQPPSLSGCSTCHSQYMSNAPTAGDWSSLKSQRDPSWWRIHLSVCSISAWSPRQGEEDAEHRTLALKASTEMCYMSPLHTFDWPEQVTWLPLPSKWVQKSNAALSQGDKERVLWQPSGVSLSEGGRVTEGTALVESSEKALRVANCRTGLWTLSFQKPTCSVGKAATTDPGTKDSSCLTGTQDQDLQIELWKSVHCQDLVQSDKRPANSSWQAEMSSHWLLLPFMENSKGSHPVQKLCFSFL